MKKLGLLIILGAYLGCSVQADLLAEWENDDLAASSTFATADSVHSDLSASTLTISTMNSSAGYPDALAAIQNNAGINSLSSAITANHYFSFTLTADAGASASYSELFLRYSVAANVQPATTVFSLLSSLSGFTSTDAIDTLTADANVVGVVVGTGNFDITGTTELQSVAAGAAVEFRLYTHNTAANSMTRIGIGHAFATNGTADLTLNGTVSAVPEPASALLLAFGGAGLFWIRRQKKS